jgi:N-acetylglucosaminyl-diphospho-decaprenol L-rhamnosyltransferase
MPPISVLVVTYRTPQLTAAAVASALRVDDVSEVIVVDNAGDADTPRLLQALDDERVQYVVNQRNTGYGQAANVAAKQATGQILIFLNSDAELAPEAATALVDEVQWHSGRGLVGARLIGPDGIIQRSAGLLPAPSDLTVRALGAHQVARALARLPVIGSFMRDRSMAREYELAATATEPVSTTMVSGACFAIGREAFLEIGGFDEAFFLYFEDADLCRRVLKAGMPIRYLPQAVVTHIGGGSSAEDYHFSPRHARSMRLYLGKWYGPPGAALASVLMFLRALGFSVGAPRRAGRAWSAFAATLGFGGGAPA